MVSANGETTRRFLGDENGDKGKAPNRQQDKNLMPIAWWSFCFGHCPSLTIFLESQSGPLWILPKLIDALLRGIGQVLFANNPFSGLLLLSALAWYSWYLGGLVIAATNTAILTAMITRQPIENINNGLISFNAVLIASVNYCVWEKMYNYEVPIKVYILVLLAALLSVFIFDGLSNLLSSFRPPIPVLSMPFHAATLAFFVCMKREQSNEGNSLGGTINNGSIMLGSENDILVEPSNVTTEDFYSWETMESVVYGTGVSATQVFGFPDPYCSMLMTLGMILYSPLLAFMCTYGAFLSTVTSLLLSSFPNEQILQGVYGFNGFLSSGAITLFYVFNRYSFLNATVNAISTAIVQISLTSLFSRDVPVYGLPFLISTAIFISMTGNGSVAHAKHFVRLGSVMTFPEMDRRLYYRRSRLRTTDEDEVA